jgi:hypothetical protein
VPDPAAEAETPPQPQPLLDEEAWQEVEVVVVERQGKGIRKVTSLLLFIIVADPTHFDLGRIFKVYILYK